METNNYLELSDKDIEKIFANRIIQSENFNSYSELFIYNNEVYKIYLKNPELSKQNIDTIIKLFEYKNEVSQIKEIVLPRKLLVYNNQIVGYKMPLIKGTLLLMALQYEKINKTTIKSYFIQLLRIINQTRSFSFQFSFNDLHEKNIIIDKDGNLNIIDSDGFVINNKMYREQNIIVYGKYLNNSITTKEPNSIDYICLLCMILNYLLKDIKDYNFNPLTFFESSKIHNITIKEIFRRVRFKNFILTEQDIENLFSLDLNFSKHKVSILAKFKCKNQLKKIERLRRK